MNNSKVQDKQLMKQDGNEVMYNFWWQTMRQVQSNAMEEDKQIECYHAQTHAKNQHFKFQA